jgi:hypothetical protein
MVIRCFSLRDFAFHWYHLTFATTLILRYEHLPRLEFKVRHHSGLYIPARQRACHRLAANAICIWLAYAHAMNKGGNNSLYRRMQLSVEGPRASGGFCASKGYQARI